MSELTVDRVIVEKQEELSHMSRNAVFTWAWRCAMLLASCVFGISDSFYAKTLAIELFDEPQRKGLNAARNVPLYG